MTMIHNRFVTGTVIVTLLCSLSLSLSCSPNSMSKVQFTETPQEVPQPLDPGPVSEEFVQGSQPSPVDILIVTDNSRSMVEEQEKMAERTQNLLNEIETLDWQIGFTTTDVSNGPYGLKGELLPLSTGQGRILKKSNPEAPRIFAETITREETLTCVTDATCPSWDEQPLTATLMALQKKNGVNAGFFRSDADLMVLMISDENERSDGGSGALSGAALVAGLRLLMNPEQKILVSAIVVKPGDTACHLAQQPDGRYATILAALVQLTGGFLGSVCAADYAEQLKKIGQLVRKSADSFELAQRPLPDTLQLSFVPEQPQTEWKLMGQKVLFSKNPPAIGTWIKATYRPAP